MTKLLEGERLDDLNIKGYEIIQHKDKFCFGMDAVLLSEFAVAKKGERVLDLGTGTGVIPILMEAKDKGTSFSALEIQSESADMARRSVEHNGLSHKIAIVEGDIKEAAGLFGKAVFDVITCNPPYMNDKHGLKNPDLPKAIARHEVLCTLEDVISQSAALLKERGRFYMVHRPTRLQEIITLMHQYHLEPKRLRMVHSYVDSDANMVLIEGLKGGGVFMKVEKPLIIYEKTNTYTKEVRSIYE
jgi:tRNA1Val (adenine37-N6)-methyltransferase